MKRSLSQGREALEAKDAEIHEQIAAALAEQEKELTAKFQAQLETITQQNVVSAVASESAAPNAKHQDRDC